MAKRADIAKRRFFSWALMYADGYTHDSPEERAVRALNRTADECEHGGTGIGRATVRQFHAHVEEWDEELTRIIAGRLIAEGC